MLRAGPISNRLVYRWLRRQGRHDRLLGRARGNVYLKVAWAVDEHELPDEVWFALRALDLPCKTIDTGPTHWEVRTRCWQGRAQPIVHGHEPGARRPGAYTDEHDRARGQRYASLVGSLLRAAHRTGVDLTVRSA